jgi:DNA-binding transcriptional LysR family regulator
MNPADLGIELTHLRYFVAVAEELHFGRAAARLRLSQPPLTQQIQRLEERLGAPLFLRTTRKTELTAAGTALLTAARLVLEDARRAFEAARGAGRGEVGQVVIATPPSLMLGPLPRLVRAFRKAAPQVAVRLREMSTAAAAVELARGEADIGFLRGPRVPPGLVEQYRFTEPLAAILPRGHPLAGRRSVRLAQLAGEAFAFFPRRLGPEFHDELTGLCRAAGFEPRIGAEATQWTSVFALVEAGFGVTIAPGGVARLAVRGLRAASLRGLETAVVVATGPAPPSPAASRFLEASQTQYRA